MRRRESQQRLSFRLLLEESESGEKWATWEEVWCTGSSKKQQINKRRGCGICGPTAAMIPNLRVPFVKFYSCFDDAFLIHGSND